MQASLPTMEARTGRGTQLALTLFAVTLSVGLMSNLFTSTFVSKTLFELVLSRRHQVATLSI